MSFVQDTNTGWHRVIECLVLTGHFPQTSPTISASFAKTDLQLKAYYASSPPCTQLASVNQSLFRTAYFR